MKTKSVIFYYLSLFFTALLVLILNISEHPDRDQGILIAVTLAALFFLVSVIYDVADKVVSTLIQKDEKG